ncbi:DinB family protein [Rasiella sp. SM2506]|uniref:DinB family protein n=1 Tax=Rasiella sp. SM2506 TaxID=3423914 RepID=UPI003D795CB0
MSYTPSDGFPYYFSLIGNVSCQKLFSSASIFEFLESIDEEKANHRYASDKWNIKQIVGHMTDHERIKMSRAHLLSRNETLRLWGYDQNSLVEKSRFDELTFKHLVLDFENVRKASISFIDGLSKNQLKIKGMANEYEITLEDFLKSIIGHEIHHINIIKEKYI